MPTIDKRNTVEHLHTGGSDVGLQVYLPEDVAKAVYGETAVAGWYTFGTFEGGTIAYRVEAEDDEDEAGQLTGKTIENSAAFELANTLKESDDATQDLIDDHLTKGFYKYRYALPFGEGVVEPGPPVVRGPRHQVYGVARGKAQPGFETQTGKGQKRTRQFVMRSTKYQGVPAFVRKTVSLQHETAWPAALAPFKSAA